MAKKTMKSFLILLMFIACAQEKPAAQQPEKPKATPPSAEEAKELIGSSGEFSEFEFTNAAFTLPMKKSLMLNDPTREAAKDLEKGGWITMVGDEVFLNAKASTDRRFITRPNGYTDIVPLARKQIGEVTAVRPTAEGVDVDFGWTWLVNEIGGAFKSGPIHDRYASPHQATATLYHDGAKWGVLRIKART